MEGEGEFDSAKGGGEMTRVECEGMDDVVTQFDVMKFGLKELAVIVLCRQGVLFG